MRSNKGIIGKIDIITDKGIIIGVEVVGLGRLSSRRRGSKWNHIWMQLYCIIRKFYLTEKRAIQVRIQFSEN